MPRLSDSMEEGTILQWLKQPGEEVAVGDELVEIETDKANMAYESDVAGTLGEILVAEGETVAIGTPIARVDGAGTGAGAAGPVAAGEDTSASAAGPATASGGPAGGGSASVLGPPESAPPAEEAAINAPQAPNGGGRPQAPQASNVGARPHASPIARRLAEERKLDLAELQGSGPGGRIVKADVERAASSAGGAVGGTAPEDASAPAGGGGSLQRQDPRSRRPDPRPQRPVPHPRPRRGPSATKSRASCSPLWRGGWRSRRRPHRTSTSRRRSI